MRHLSDANEFGKARSLREYINYSCRHSSICGFPPEISAGNDRPIKNLGSKAAKDDSDVVKFEHMMLHLPPPMPFAIPTPIDEKSMIVMTKTPHKIIDASISLCAELRFQQSQLLGRSLSVLYGPGTDPSCISLAIKNMAADIHHRAVAVSSIDIYGQDGGLRRFRVLYSPTTDKNDCAGCCKLAFERTDAPAVRRMLPRSVDEERVRQAVRSRYNFLTGLELHQEHVRKSLRLPKHLAKDVEEDIDEELFFLLLG